MFFIPQANQSDPEERGLAHVNRNFGIGGSNCCSRRLPLVIGNVSQIDHWKRDGKTIFYLLKWLAVHNHETCAPSFVAAQNFVEAAFQGAHVQSPRVMNGYRLVVKRKLRRQLCMNPYLLLRMRERNSLTGLSARNLRSLGTQSELAPEILLQQLALRVGVFRAHFVSSLVRKTEVLRWIAGSKRNGQRS